jgi:uncharacterized membrane protein
MNMIVLATKPKAQQQAAVLLMVAARPLSILLMASFQSKLPILGIGYFGVRFCIGYLVIRFHIGYLVVRFLPIDKAQQQAAVLLMVAARPLSILLMASFQSKLPML